MKYRIRSLTLFAAALTFGLPAHAWRVDKDGVTQMKLTEAGRLGVGTNDPSTNRVAIRGATNDASAGGLWVGGATGNTPGIYVRNDGKVGVGTGAPSAALEVAGQVKITGGSPGLGRVLTSDASGLASWGLGGRLKIDANFDCTFGGEFQIDRTAFKFDLGSGAYRCLYAFYVGEYSASSAGEANLSNVVNACAKNGLRDAHGIKIPLMWRRDNTTWLKLWDEARTHSTFGVFVMLGNAGDWNGDYMLGVDLLWDDSHRGDVHAAYGRGNWSVWHRPAEHGTQYGDYAAHATVLCEL